MKKTNTIATLVFRVNRRISLWVHARRLEAERAEAKLARSIERARWRVTLAARRADTIGPR